MEKGEEMKEDNEDSEIYNQESWDEKLNEALRNMDLDNMPWSAALIELGKPMAGCIAIAIRLYMDLINNDCIPMQCKHEKIIDIAISLYNKLVIGIGHAPQSEISIPSPVIKLDPSRGGFRS